MYCATKVYTMTELFLAAADAGYKDRVIVKLERDLGPDILKALHEPTTIEIMVNADGHIWLEKLGQPMHCIGSLPQAKSEAIIKTIAGYHNKEATRLKPVIEGELPIITASRTLPRFAGSLPPVVASPIFAIRLAAVALFSLDDYVAQGVMNSNQADLIKSAVSAHKNILVSGGTGSGKTTLMNAIIQQIVINDHTERIVIIEDNCEIQCAAANAVQFHTSLDVNLSQLLKTSLRLRPDRILIGEVRGEEALDLLLAWNTGHEGGVATLHANNAVAALTRLTMLVSMAKQAPRAIEPLIGEVVHWVIHIAKTPKGRKVTEMIEIAGFANGDYHIRSLI
jgi:type IV secretion system protein TrbB